MFCNYQSKTKGIGQFDFSPRFQVRWIFCSVVNKHLMTGSKGNSGFCFPETLNIPEAKPKGTLMVVNLICFCRIINPFSWIMNAFSSEKRWPTSMAFWHRADWHTNLPPFQGARPDHVRVESSSCCFPRELVSFDPWHVKSSPPIGKRIWVERYNNGL